jgi:hypothetical protein
VKTQTSKNTRTKRFAKSPWEKTLQHLHDRAQEDAALLVDPKTHRHYNMVRAAIAAVRPKFQGNHLMAADTIINALQIAQDYKLRSKKPYRGTRSTWKTLGQRRRAGRPRNDLWHFYLFSALMRAWILGFGQLPRINQKRDPIEAPFVTFARTILRPLGMGNKLVDYIDKYRSYKKALRRGINYEQWCRMRKAAQCFRQGGAICADC